MAHLTPNQELQILNLYSGLDSNGEVKPRHLLTPIAKAERALAIMEAFQANKATKALQLRINIVGLVIND